MLSLWIILASASDPAQADSELTTPDVISCLKRIDPLNQRYRGWMQQRCATVAVDIRIQMDKGAGSCLPGLVAPMREFYGELMPLLPPELDGGRSAAGGFQRALARAGDTFDKVPECAGMRGYEYTTCESIQMAVATMGLFYPARLADVALK